MVLMSSSSSPSFIWVVLDSSLSSSIDGTHVLIILPFLHLSRPRLKLVLFSQVGHNGPQSTSFTIHTFNMQSNILLIHISITEQVMSSSFSPSWQQTVLGLIIGGACVVRIDEPCSPAWYLPCSIIRKLGKPAMTWLWSLHTSSWSYCFTIKGDFMLE